MNRVFGGGRSGTFLLFALLLAVSGCRRITDKIAEKSAESQTGAKVALSSAKQEMTVEGGHGTATTAFGGSARVPDDFPKDVPMYPDAKITGSVSVNDKKKHGSMVMFDTADTPDNVAAFYKSKLQGYSSGMDVAAPASRMMAMTSSDGKLSVSIIATKSDKGSSVQLTAGLKSAD